MSRASLTKCGADDYLVKPFSRDELLASVRALLRRVGREREELTEVTLGAVKVDFKQCKAWRHDEPIELTAKELEVLRLLLERPGEVVSRNRFLDVAWGFSAFPTTRTVDKHIARLRKKIEPDPDHPKWIHTVHGIGYRLELE